jgi:chromate transporter
MNLLLLYALLLKATCTSFSGLASLPILRADLVEHRHVLTDAQLNMAVTAGRSGPGPMGIYVVCVGYQVGAVPGAFAGLMATMTPAFVIIVLLRWLGTVAERPAVQRTIRAVLVAAAGLLAATTANLATSGIPDGFAAAVAAASFSALAFTRVDSAWVMLTAAVIGAVRAYWRLN